MLAAIGIPGIATSFRMFEIEIERIYRGSLASECKIDTDPVMSSSKYTKQWRPKLVEEACGGGGRLGEWPGS